MKQLQEYLPPLPLALGKSALGVEKGLPKMMGLGKLISTEP